MSSSGSASLSVREHMTLRIAFTRYRFEGRRESDARALLGYSPTTFWLMAERLLGTDAALRAYPVEVGRLRRLRADRRWARSKDRILSAGL